MFVFLVYVGSSVRYGYGAGWGAYYSSRLSSFRADQYCYYGRDFVYLRVSYVFMVSRV